MTEAVMVLPLPNDEYDDAIVVASVWIDDDTGRALLILLRKEVPYFAVVEIEWQKGTWTSVNETPHVNIVPTVDFYQECGGDY